jgi:hypothetical protein
MLWRHRHRTLATGAAPPAGAGGKVSVMGPTTSWDGSSAKTYWPQKHFNPERMLNTKAAARRLRQADLPLRYSAPARTEVDSFPPLCCRLRAPPARQPDCRKLQNSPIPRREHAIFTFGESGRQRFLPQPQSRCWVSVPSRVSRYPEVTGTVSTPCPCTCDYLFTQRLTGGHDKGRQRPL